MYSTLALIAIFIFGYHVCDAIEATTRAFRTIKMDPKVAWNETNLDKLKKDLFINYDKYARPYQHFHTTELRLGISITHIETDQLKSTFTVHGRLRLVWNDPKLRWNEDDYGGVTFTRIADHEIWQPDIYLYNSAAGGEQMVRFGNPNAIVYSNGEVLWVPPTKLTALCKFNLRHWPFDTQHCFLKFGSWTHSGHEIKLKLYNDKQWADFENTISYSAWNVSNSTAEVMLKYYDCCPEPYYSLQYNLTLVRKSESYKAVVVTPAVVNALLILMQFWLPPQAQEKLILNGFTATSLIIFLIYFTNGISPAGANTPLIVLFYSCSLYMVCFAMLVNTVAFWLSKGNQIHYMSWAIKRHLRGTLRKWLLLEFRLRESCEGTQSQKSIKAKHLQIREFGIEEEYLQIMKSPPENRCQEEWFLAIVINRFLFIIYGLIFLIFGMIYLI